MAVKALHPEHARTDDVSCPLIGDVKYGKGEHSRLFRERHGLHRLALHAWSLALPHPRTGATVRAIAPLPEDFMGALEGLGIAEALPAELEAACSS